jgi:hypothetical protein
MSAPVWILSVDLQTKTATFQSGMADAARSARSAFKEINDGASEMGGAVSKGSLDVRHALGLVDNTIRGAHSMAMVDLIRMFQDSALVMGALPFAMTVAGFALVAEMVAKGVQAFNEYRQAQEKLKDEQTKFGTEAQDVFNGLGDKILEAQKQTDDLTGNHLGALEKELKLIDHQDLGELRHSFDTLAADAEKHFAELKASWYEFGIGSDGARHALEQFKTQYESLLSKGRDKEAADLLAGTKQSAETILAAMQFVKNNMPTATVGGAWQPDAKTLQYYRDANTLKAAGVGITDKEIASQQMILSVLADTETARRMSAAAQKDEDTNARLTTAKEISKQDNGTDSKIAEGRARMMSDLYSQYQQKVQIVQDGERQTLAATKEGTAERLQAIEDAMQREEADGLQDTAFYKSLAIQKLEVQRQIGDEQTAMQAAIDREASDNALKFGELDIAAEKEKQALINSSKRVSLQTQLEQDIQFADEEYNIKKAALDREIEGLNQSDQKYLVSKQKLQDQEKQLIQQHENELAAIREKKEIETNQKLSNSYQQFATSVAGSMSQLIMGHQTLAKTFENLADQMISNMIKNAVLYEMSNKFRQQSDARAAGAAGFKWGMENGGPAAPVLAHVMGAAAFVGALAFEQGTDRVPGVGLGDIVPTMLEPGEGVVPGGVMDGLRNMARSGGFDAQQSVTHIHIRPTYHVNTIDGDGMNAALNKHADQLEQHFHRAVRRMNR